MKNHKRDIIFAIVVVIVISVFFFGIINWPKYQQAYTNKIQKNLYYVTVSSCLYMLSFLVLLLADKLWVKVGATLLFSVFGVNLYIELFADPQHWSNWDIGMYYSVAANLVLAAIILELIKKKL